MKAEGDVISTSGSQDLFSSVESRKRRFSSREAEKNPSRFNHRNAFGLFRI